MQYPMSEQKLAHAVLIELLAYQFASPVRWIETQDVLFEECHTERLVEIGPAAVLSGIAKRTLAAKHAEKDSARSFHREILSSAKDASAIGYHVEPAHEEPAPKAELAVPATPLTASVTPSQEPAPFAAPLAATVVATIADAPIAATDVVRIIIARKVKKVLENVPATKSIKALCGGKSALQNELLGDLEVEFGRLPDSAEDLPLSELGNSVKTNGSLGKQSSALVAKMMSAKMPSGFNYSAGRAYLESRWGLGEVRQQAVLLEALLNEPPARLATQEEAKAFLDGSCKRYASRLGLDLASPASVQVSQGPATIDPYAMQVLSKKQDQYLTKQLVILAKHLNIDLSSATNIQDSAQHEISALTARLDLWNSEVGDSFISGAQPIFTSLQVRTYDSWWNWVRVDLAEMYYQALNGTVDFTSDGARHGFRHILNRATPALLKFIQGYVLSKARNMSDGVADGNVQMVFVHLLEDCTKAIDLAPVFRPLALPSGPCTTMDAKGSVTFSEIPRTYASTMEDYVLDLAGNVLANSRNKSWAKIRNVPSLPARSHFEQPNSDAKDGPMAVIASRLQFFDESNSVQSSGSSSPSTTEEITVETSATTPYKGTFATSTFASMQDVRDAELDYTPLVHLQTKSGGAWKYNTPLTRQYFEALRLASTTGVTFEDKCCLITGAGPGSIGSYLVKGLIAGGAKVVVTTSRASKQSTEFFRSMYVEHGARGSKLVVVPFNQASKQDGQSLINYIYDTLSWDLDIMIPFAAMSENGRDITNLDSTSELAHRMMLTNVIRLMGYTKQVKEQRGYDARPTQVLLPLSPNHGNFGGDGLYSESKIALETLSNRWTSEDWGDYLSICGAVIGWTRGTGLMSANDLIAEALERQGIKTFSQHEMALNLLGLLVPTMAAGCQLQPILAEISGGMHLIPDLKDLTSKAREETTITSELRKTQEAERQREVESVQGSQTSTSSTPQTMMVEPLANLKVSFPKLPNYKTDLLSLSEQLRGMIDLDQVIVVTGFAETGPWGNARTRWEMEAYGTFSIEGSIEMAWIMGLIKHSSPQDNTQVGWVDAKTGKKVSDSQIKKEYEKEILEHSGVRLIESKLIHGYDPRKKEVLQEVAIDEDLEPFEASAETAQAFKKQHGVNVHIEPLESDQWSIRLRKGAILLIPKAISFDRLVAGQLPTGWNPERYGISKDIVDQVDPVTLFTLISVSESLLSSGITDPYEIYRYIHMSEVGNCIGSGAGGVHSLRQMYRERHTDLPVQSDIFQETFINTTSAWVNMLLMSSAGPNKTPVGACATAVESVELGCEAIMTGKAKLCLVGGTDDIGEESSYEFGNMKATSSAEDEYARGRFPSDMSRPTTSSRSGFMESQGAGVQILMNAKLALAMGVPIYGIVALTSTASDKIGRSVPAPGQGILTNARETPQSSQPPILDMSYRKHQLQSAFDFIASWKKCQQTSIQLENGAMDPVRAGSIERETLRQQNQALQTWGNYFWKQDPQISPIRGALATWGLTIDDIDVASFHGTSTVANDLNESEVICKQLRHLKHREGNAVLGIFQKYLTGHPKGAAGAWMLNGCLQVLNSGIVPGNRNADNIDDSLKDFDPILFPNRTIHTPGVKAFSLTSFGFGQKGAQLIGVHPKYLFATLNESTYQAYVEKVTLRERKADQRLHDMLVKNNVVLFKDHPPFEPSEESDVYLNPEARLCFLPSSNGYSFDAKRPEGNIELVPETIYAGHASTTDSITSSLDTPAPSGSESLASISFTSEETIANSLIESLLVTMSAADKPHYRIGVDVESTASLPITETTFITRNFTSAEQLYVRNSAAGDNTAYTRLWCAKEAVFKSLGVQGRGAGAALKEIEITHNGDGKPGVLLHGEAKQRASRAGVLDVEVSVSRCDKHITAVALARVENLGTPL